VRTLAYGERLQVGDVVVSFHPSGHVPGSAQVRVEHRGEVWVASGDYKVGLDVTCAPFEQVKCQTFVAESTFALPIYRWQEPEFLFAAINDWWRDNQGRGKTSVRYAYAVGKSQRILGGIDASIREVRSSAAG
jgi:putative mRNA 3-end processing factor